MHVASVACTATTSEDQGSHGITMSQRSPEFLLPLLTPLHPLGGNWMNTCLPLSSHSLKPISLGLPHFSLACKFKKYQRGLTLSEIAFISVESVDWVSPLTDPRGQRIHKQGDVAPPTLCGWSSLNSPTSSTISYNVSHHSFQRHKRKIWREVSYASDNNVQSNA